MTQEPADSIITYSVSDTTSLSGGGEGSGLSGGGYPRTPYQVLRMLPRDATPAQQDSAIQAWFQPGEIRYSDRPDTLHLPGHGVGRNLKDVNLPQYYRESFFSNDSLLHPEINGGRYGVAGDPVPYTLRGDNVITSLLLACFIMAAIAFASSRRFITKQLKDFIYLPRSEESTLTETSSEIRYQFFFVLQTCLLLSITYFFYVINFVTRTFVLDSTYLLVGIFFAVFLGWMVMRAVGYSMVNCVFFSGKKNIQWMKSLLFITAAEGVILFPAVLLQVYFYLPFQNVVYFFIFALILIKILTFYKCWVIFFRQNAFSLQIFLYFCALEIIPLMALWGIMAGIVNELKINF